MMCSAGNGHRVCFVVELGSQKLTALIDAAFQKRAASATQGAHTTPPGHEDVEFLDKVTNLWEYLTHACGAAGLHELDVIARPPYAYIGDPNQVCVKPPNMFHPLPGNANRWALRFDVEHVASGKKFLVILNHSLSS